MMVTLSLIADYFNDENKDELFIYQTFDSRKKRFQFQKNLDLLPNLSYVEMQYERDNLKFDVLLTNHIKELLKLDIDTFVFFNHHLNLPVYLAKELFKRGAKIILAPDGMKSYNESKKITPRWSILGAIHYYRFTKSKKLSNNWYFPTMPYANLKEIEKVFIQYPYSYKNYSKKQVQKFDLLSSEKAKFLNYKYFKFDQEKELQAIENVIFFINTPFIDEKLIDFEFKIIDQLQLMFQEHIFIIKLHPLTSNRQIEKYALLKNVQLINKSYPAELYIAELKNSKVLSFWSTGSLINNVDVSIYWLYPILVKNNLMLDYVKIHNPTNHIIEVDSIDKII